MADTHSLPRPHAQVWDWQRRAACRGMDSATFFPPEGERGLPRARREDQAKAICGSCPVLQQCREHALSVPERYGVWGGLSAFEREQLLRTQRRGLSVSGAARRVPPGDRARQG